MHARNTFSACGLRSKWCDCAIAPVCQAILRRQPPLSCPICAATMQQQLTAFQLPLGIHKRMAISPTRTKLAHDATHGSLAGQQDAGVASDAARLLGLIGHVKLSRARQPSLTCSLHRPRCKSQATLSVCAAYIKPAHDRSSTPPCMESEAMVARAQHLHLATSAGWDWLANSCLCLAASLTFTARL